MSEKQGALSGRTAKITRAENGYVVEYWPGDFKIYDNPKEAIYDVAEYFKQTEHSNG